jgi:hypothetical protein
VAHDLAMIKSAKNSIDFDIDVLQFLKNYLRIFLTKFVKIKI